MYCPVTQMRMQQLLTLQFSIFLEGSQLNNSFRPKDATYLAFRRQEIKTWTNYLSLFYYNSSCWFDSGWALDSDWPFSFAGFSESLDDWSPWGELSSVVEFELFTSSLLLSDSFTGFSILGFGLGILSMLETCMYIDIGYIAIVFENDTPLLDCFTFSPEL